MKPSRSLDRNTFQVNNYIDRCFEEGKEPNPEYIKLYQTENERDNEWAAMDNHDNDMEWDLRTTDWILKKVRASETYAQNLYAAMCNNDFQRIDVFPILASQTWSCSWRYAGGIIADMRQEGDYIDWYCSGIREDVNDQQYMDMTDQEKDAYDKMRGYVAESMVTDEIRIDLEQLGWMVLENNNEDI